jgi:hypothetical protein
MPCSVRKVSYMNKPTIHFLKRDWEVSFWDYAPNTPFAIKIRDLTVLPQTADEQLVPETHIVTVWHYADAPGELGIKDYGKLTGILDAFVDAGILAPPHRLLTAGNITIPVCYLAEGFKVRK